MALVLGALLAGCAAYAAWVLNQASYAQVLAQGRLPYFDGEYAYLPVRVSASEFARAQWALLAGAGGLGLAVGWGCATRAGGQELRTLGAEARASLARLGRGVGYLTPGQRWGAGLSLALLTGARVYFSVVRPYHPDEVASYDFFIRPGLLSVSSFYPIPNNHVLANTLSWWFFRVYPQVWFTLRLPVLLTSTLGTVVLFAGLRRVSSFRVALVALTLLGWVQPSLYYAGAGRGYWLLLALAGGHFLAVVALLGRPQVARVAWAAWLVTGVLGCYTVPTFAYVVASAASYLGVAGARRRSWVGVGQVAAGVLAMGAGAALLYTPLLLLSGWRLLLANGYVVSQPVWLVVQALPGFAWLTEGVLWGHDTRGAWGFVLAMGALGWLLWAQLRAARSPGLPGPGLRPLVAMRRVGWPALWFVLFPYALVLGQRVLPPARTLLYKALFFYVLVGILLDAGLHTRRAGWWAPRLAGLAVAVFVGYQAYAMSALVAASQRQVASSYQVFDWLAARPAGPVLVRPGETALYLLFLAHYRTPHRPWQLATRARPGAYYRYVVVPQGYARPAPPARLAYQNERADIYELPMP